MRRKQFLLGCGVAAGLMLLSWVAQGASRADIWWHDFQQAAAEAQRTGKPMLLHFHASWCGPCREMERDVFSDREVQEFLASNFIPVKVDCSQPNPIAEEFDLQKLPTDLILSPNKEEWSRIEGFGGMKKVGRRAYMDGLSNVIAQHVRRNPPDAIAKNDTDKPLETKQTPVDKPNQKLIVGLERFSPVALVKHRQWKKGSSEFAWEYQGVVFLMCDEAEVREFKNDPQKYAPKLLGCDPVELWTADKAVVGSTQYGAIFDDGLYLFKTAENRDRFKKEPNLFTKPQHVLKVNDVDGPRWR